MPGRCRTAGLIAALLLICISGPVYVPGLLVAQVDPGRRASTTYMDISIEAATHLRTAASYIKDQNWPEAIELFDKLIQNFGDKVIQVGSGRRYVSVRDYCHMQLVKLPAAARQDYRRRVDAQAETWYRAGVADRDAELLRRVVAQAFASSWGDDALDALAELALEGGRFDEARSLWRRIDTGWPEADVSLADPAAKRLDDAAKAQQPPTHRLVYPDTNLDRSLIDAKKLLCRIFAGEKEQTAKDIVEFRQRYPNARGTLGAVTGPLADRLASIAREHAALVRPEDGLWTTFAGNAQRSKASPQAVDVGSVQWTAALPQSYSTRAAGRPPLPTNQDDLSFHPVIVGGWVLICGRDEVRAYDLHEGPKDGDKPAWAFKLRDNQNYVATVVRPTAGSPQHTLTVEGGRLYVRLGSPETSVAPRRPGFLPDSYLVCLDLAAEGKELWRITPEPNEPDLAFEGSPVVANGNVYIGITRGGAMTHSFVACYDAATGAKKWRQLICEASSANTFQGWISHNLLTLGAGMIFYNTNLGAVAALDEATGRVRWISTYERDDSAPLNRAIPIGQEPNPCVYHDGLVMALPSDSRGVWAFDALSGELRWQTPDSPRIRYLLGVAHGKLICSGNQVVAIDLATGRRVWQWPEASGMTSYGRGVLAGDYVYYPTKTHIYILEQRTGELAKPPVALLEEPHNQPTGNLVIADGYLVVAQAKNLTTFCQYDVLINRYRDLIAQNPASAEPHFRLAEAAERIKDRDLAVEHYRQAIKLAGAGETLDERPIKPVVQLRLYSLLLVLGAKSGADKQWPDAERQYREASSIAATEQGKLDALLRLAELWSTAEDGKRALAVYQELLAENALHGLAVQLDPSRSVRADVEIANRVRTLLERFGRGIYAPFERAARDAFALAQAQQAGSLSDIERMIRAYPNAQLVPQARLYLAAQYVANEQFALASAAYKQLLDTPGNLPDVRLAALHGLAQTHETQRAWNGARRWWQRMAQEFPDAPLPTRPEQSVASFVKEHLSRDPYDQDNSNGEHLEFPLLRRWSRLWNEKTRVLVPDGEHPPDQGVLLLASDGESLRCIAGPSGDDLWQTNLAAPVRWCALHDGRLLVGCDTQLVSFDVARGELLWRQALGAAEDVKANPPADKPPAPSARDDVKTNRDPEKPASTEFRMFDDWVFVREGTRRLVCLSAQTGAVQWSYAPTEGSILPYPFFSTQHVALLQRLPDAADRPRRSGKLVVLDGDGRLRSELTQPGDAWRHPPVAVDHHRICIATDARTIQLIDLTDGRPVWSFESPSSDRPAQPIVAPGGLLVLVGRKDLVRLNADTGQELWSQPISDEPLPDSPSVWAVDEDRFYCVTRELNLRAFRLTDGKLDWQQSLVGPGEEWQVAISGSFVVALPSRPSADEGLPVNFCRASDGRLIQRLLFRPHGSEAVLHLGPNLTLVGSEREVWALSKH